jgi:hypothetical protein
MMRSSGLTDLVRCAETDSEGYRCALSPNHDGPHRWMRCEWTDPAGRRCILPPRHPGSHDLAWYDALAATGSRHTVRYHGPREASEARAAREEEVFRAHGWAVVSSGYKLDRWWRIGPLAALLGLFWLPGGTLAVDYAFGSPFPPRPAGVAGGE